MKRLLAGAVLSVAAWAQVWSGSGSNGTDGALDLGNNTPGVVNGVLIFDPVALNNIDADGDNVYHFTTITIRDNIEVRFLTTRMRRVGPVIFLASGNVFLNGRLNFSGEDGHTATNNDSLRRISIPGPGGYPGGIGGKTSALPTAGAGPGGGRPSTSDGSRGCPGAHTNALVPGFCSNLPAPPSYGTNLLQPLVGGSGGGGARVSWFGAQVGGPGGGAGGGAFRLSSSTAIVFGASLSGQTASVCNSERYIIADGGAGGVTQFGGRGGGAGAGGAIHLQAPLIAGCNNTHVYARGGAQNDTGGSEGRIRLDANQFGSVGSVPLGSYNALVDAPLPPNPPVLRVVSINGVAVPTSPKFDYASPDVVINSTSPVPVVLAGQNIPVGTTITVFLTTDTGADITTAATLSGTPANSTATVNVTLPLGTARLIARAIW